MGCMQALDCLAADECNDSNAAPEPASPGQTSGSGGLPSPFNMQTLHSDQGKLQGRPERTMLLTMTQSLIQPPEPRLASTRTVTGSWGVQVTRLYWRAMRPLTKGASCKNRNSRSATIAGLQSVWKHFARCYRLKTLSTGLSTGSKVLRKLWWRLPGQHSQGRMRVAGCMAWTWLLHHMNC